MIRAIVSPPIRKRRKSNLKVSLRRAIDATIKSGVPVSSVRIYPDGSFVLSSTAASEHSESSAFDRWEERL